MLKAFVKLGSCRLVGKHVCNFYGYENLMNAGVMQNSTLVDSTSSAKAELASTEHANKRPHVEDGVEKGEENSKRFRSGKKKKVAMLLSYCGQGYLGMQINHGFKTIEGDLFQAFLKVGIMDEEAFKIPQTVHFQRAARTDKGVSAIRQVVSFKITPPDEKLVREINSALPDTIKVHSIKRVTAGFNSKTACDNRSYAYILPTFAFSPEQSSPSAEYRTTEECLAELNSILSSFKGTHNFHNFTSGKSAHDPSSKRYVTCFTSGQPYVVEGIEFIKITIRGQSFMLHQIRKMIGLTIAVMRGLVPKTIFESVFKMERVNVLMAPSLNLVLEEPHYESYNKRYGSDGVHEPLEWTPFAEDVKTFADNVILPVIYKGEKTEADEKGSMSKWLEILPLHTFSFATNPNQNSNASSDTNVKDSDNPVQQINQDLNA